MIIIIYFKRKDIKSIGKYLFTTLTNTMCNPLKLLPAVKNAQYIYKR